MFAWKKQKNKGGKKEGGVTHIIEIWLLLKLFVFTSNTEPPRALSFTDRDLRISLVYIQTLVQKVT